ncbi:spore morphogenesis/germination protein YwcE [Fictibacillus sp. Mic-4]|uniref:spore morphogenesis/germination protein YwcE n=1 Tax=Fictibacillus TaxID=1329200 RepID=UPI0004210085|nr:spore morphogenesis/germination protein YwcE [Fictibacillus gelatini]
MDVFVVYLLVATATPLFLWEHSKKLALAQLPFIACIWAYFILYFTTTIGTTAHILFGIVFAANIIFAHIAAYLIYIAPAIKRKKMQNKNLIYK